jgi:hypothetical protein
LIVYRKEFLEKVELFSDRWVMVIIRRSNCFVLVAMALAVPELFFAGPETLFA